MATQTEPTNIHLIGWPSTTLQGLSLGTTAPWWAPYTHCSWHPVVGSALGFPSVLCQWSHHGSPGPCSGPAAWPTEGLPSPPKLHLSSGALQVSERLVRDNPSGHTIRKVSWLLAGIAAAGEDSAHFTALTVLCYILKTFVYPCPEFEEGYHPKRWDSSPLPKTLHLQQAEF